MAENSDEMTRISTTEMTTASQGESDRPPSYNSIYGRLKSARQDSKGPKDFFSKSYDIVCNSIVATILLIPMIAIPIALIVVGAIHLNNCRAERYIPIYMIVAGCFGALYDVLSFAGRARRHWREKKGGRRDGREGGGSEEEEGRGAKIYGFHNGILSCFLFAWFIAGSVWVYRIYGSVNTWDSTSLHYCHPSVYWFAFVKLTFGYAMLFLGCCLVAGCGCLFCFL